MACQPVKNVVQLVHIDAKTYQAGEQELLPSAFENFPTDLAEGEYHTVMTEYQEVGYILRTGNSYTICFGGGLVVLANTCVSLFQVVPATCEETADLPSDDELPADINVEYNNKRVDPCQN